jgi:predicted SPOUT superfamily RNA methylase MTH1
MPPGCQEYITDHKPTDRLIYEEGIVKKYEESKQYMEDIGEHKLLKENKKLKIRTNTNTIRFINRKYP